MIRFLFLVICLAGLSCYAADISQEPIKDELVEETLINVSEVYPKPANIHYTDLEIKRDIPARVHYRPLHISDGIVKHYMQNVSNVYPESNLGYDYSEIRYLPFRIRFLEPISSKGIQNTEGQIVKFVVIHDVYDGNKKLVPHGTIGTAKIETISPNGFMGVPADLIIAHFNVAGLDRKKFQGPISKSGYNLMGLAGALKYSIGTFIPGTGYLFMLIKGGHVTINTSEIFEIKYVP